MHISEGFLGSVTETNELLLCFSPFEVHVSEEAGPQKVRAWGPGLEAGVVGKSADFVVEAIGTEVGTLGMFQQHKGSDGHQTPDQFGSRSHRHPLGGGG